MSNKITSTSSYLIPVSEYPVLQEIPASVIEEYVFIGVDRFFVRNLFHNKPDQKCLFRTSESNVNKLWLSVYDRSNLTKSGKAVQHYSIIVKSGRYTVIDGDKVVEFSELTDIVDQYYKGFTIVKKSIF